MQWDKMDPVEQGSDKNELRKVNVEIQYYYFIINHENRTKLSVWKKKILCYGKPKQHL